MSASKRNRRQTKVRRAVIIHDLHYPIHNRATWLALTDYVRKNPPDVLVFAGDALDLACISHWNKNKPLYRAKGSLKRDLDGFAKHILRPLEALLPPNCQKVWLDGNHERFLTDRVEESPELFGMLDHTRYLALKDRGWKVLGQGKCFKLGKLTVIHGDTVSGGGLSAARRALDVYGSSVLLGHFHSPQSHAKISPVDARHKFMAWVAPILGRTSAAWMKRKANGWVNGFTIVEISPNGNFNVYPVVVSGGKFSFGGHIYGNRGER